MIRIENLAFTYPGATRPALRIERLHIPPGSFALVSGKSGSGKSTLLRLMNGLVPFFSGGAISGALSVNGLNPLNEGPQVMSSRVGFVFQEPENQFVVDVVEDEVAFSMENAAIPRSQMQARMQTILEQLSLEHLRSRKVNSLSGGEAQRVAIAAALVLQPQILVLDEPTSQLDPYGAQEVLTLLDDLRKLRGLTVLIAEHRLERVLPFCDLMVHLDPQRETCISGAPAEVVLHSGLQPPVVQLAQAYDWQPLPLSVEAARPFADGLTLASSEKLIRRSRYIGSHVSGAYRVGSQLSESASSLRDYGIHSEVSSPKKGAQRREDMPKEQTPTALTGPAILSVQNLNVSYRSQPVLYEISFDLHAGERLVIMGPNGAGKTTLLRSLIGLVKADSGRIDLYEHSTAGMHSAEICRQIGFLPQDPNALLFAESVTQELERTLQNHGLPVSPEAIQNLLEQLLLKEESQSYPRDLSTGERQRTALGAIAITDPPILILDEPTRGLDQAAKQALGILLKAWNARGKTVLLVTHDVEFAASFATRVALLEEGRIIANGDPRKVLHACPRYRPQIAQLFPGSGLLSVEEVKLFSS